MKTLQIYRVEYGHCKTPKDKREYRLTTNTNVLSPVGFLSEWLTFIRIRGYDKLILTELDGTTSEVDAL